jgi:hypothetical protein
MQSKLNIYFPLNYAVRSVMCDYPGYTSHPIPENFLSAPKCQVIPDFSNWRQQCFQTWLVTIPNMGFQRSWQAKSQGLRSGEERGHGTAKTCLSASLSMTFCPVWRMELSICSTNFSRLFDGDVILFTVQLWLQLTENGVLSEFKARWRGAHKQKAEPL